VEKGQAWWYTSVISASQEAEVGELGSEPSPNKSYWDSLSEKTKTKTKKEWKHD
jgi:hypothetical protein